MNREFSQKHFFNAFHIVPFLHDYPVKSRIPLSIHVKIILYSN